MNKILTIEINQESEGEFMEMHLNKEGAIFLMELLQQFIGADKNTSEHLMTPDWGGNELTSDPQNLEAGSKLVHHLKLFYWT